jgi:hypothetical protein
MKMDPAEFCLYLICEGVQQYAGVTGPAMLCSIEALSKFFHDYQSLQRKVKDLESMTGAKSRYRGGEARQIIQQPM